MATSLADLDWPLRSERLLIRPATTVDAGAMLAYRSRSAVAEWLPRHPTDPTAWRAFLTEPERLERTLLIEYDDQVVGDLYVQVRDGWAQAEVAERAEGCEAEIGWALAPPYHGRGLGTEAVAALLEICFDRLGLRRVTAGCFSDNEASWRLMERLGMRRESHTVRDALHRTRGWVDGYTYALLAEEWSARTG